MKKHLRWTDLVFQDDVKTYKVLLNREDYILRTICDSDSVQKVFMYDTDDREVCNFWSIYEEEVIFFNNLLLLEK